MKLKAKRDRVIVKKFPPEDKTDGGIIIPELARPKPQLGYVIDVGPGYKTKYGYHKENAVKIDDIVVFPKWSGANVKIKGEEFFIISANEILGVIHVEPV